MRHVLKAFHSYPALEQRFGIDRQKHGAVSNVAKHRIVLGDTDYHYVVVSHENDINSLLSMRFDAAEYNPLVPLAFLHWLPSLVRIDGR